MGKLDDATRLNMVIEALELTKNSFGIKLEYKSPATIYHIIEGRNKISDGLISKVVNTFPKVSYNFLKNGVEPVLLDEEQKVNQSNFFNIGDKKTPDFGDWASLPNKIDELIRIGNKTNELLEIIAQKKGAE